MVDKKSSNNFVYTRPMNINRTLSAIASFCFVYALAPIAGAGEVREGPGEAVPVQESSESQSQKFDLKTPFVLKGGMEDFAPRAGEKVRLFPGMVAFQGFLNAGKISVWPIAEFATPYQPENEAVLKESLLHHASQFGADYIVVLKNPAEIRRKFPSPMENLVFCAVAYRRVEARLGFETDPAAAKEGVVKISGFVAGARAEADGLRVGDVIKTVEDEEPGNSAELNNGYWSKALHWKAGDKVKVKVDRSGETLELTVELMKAG